MTTPPKTCRCTYGGFPWNEHDKGCPELTPPAKLPTVKTDVYLNNLYIATSTRFPSCKAHRAYILKNMQITLYEEDPRLARTIPVIPADRVRVFRSR